MKIDLNFMKKVFKNSLELEDYDLKLNSKYDNVPDWDSLGHMRLVSTLEEEFDIELGIEEIIGVDTVQKIRNLVNKKIKDN